MRHWTLEERQKQAELIRRWQPWKKAGVKSPEGKVISRMNAYKHGCRSVEVRKFAKTMTEWKEELALLLKSMKYAP